MIKIKNQVRRELKKCNNDCSYILDRKSKSECVNICMNARGDK